jgi:hypothetical protein
MLAVLSLREEYRLRVQRKISVPTKQDIREDWRKLHNEELCYFYSSLIIIQAVK